MQTDMEMQEYDGEERRALNMIWTAAQDHSFRPEFMAFDQEGKADLYLNSIIGYVHRWYDGQRVSELFSSFQGAALQDVYDTILWLGLESGAYQREKTVRPVLEELRGEYWEKVLCKSRWSVRERLIEALQTGRARMALGEQPGVLPWERRLLEGLDFDAEADTERIAEGVSRLLWEYFRFDCRAAARKKGREKRKGPVFLLWPFRSCRGRIVRNSLPAGEEGTKGDPRQSREEDGAERKELKAGRGLRFWLETASRHREETVRSYIEACYGMSMYGERQNQAVRHLLCTGCHSGCGLHFTRGDKFLKAPEDGEAARQLWAAARQRKKNREHFEGHRAEYQASIRCLEERIRNILLVDLQPVPEISREGRLVGSLAWKAACLGDGRVFLKSVGEERPNVSVDLMLDASASRMGHEEIIAAQGYVIAESLTRSGIPVQVYSFSAIQGYTVFRIFREYGEGSRNREILDYVAAGWNRDGLAFRAAGHLMENSPCEKRLLIVLTDASPNDEQRIALGDGTPRGKEYGGEAGIEDAAGEVRQLKKQGVNVMAVFYGLDSDLKGAQQIYGTSFARIKDMDQLAGAVGDLIAGKLSASPLLTRYMTE